MVFGGEISFSTPQKLFRPPIIFFGPPIFFFGGFLFFYAPKTKNQLFRRAPKEQYFSMPKRKNLGFSFFNFGAASLLWCSAAKSLFRPPKNILRRLFSFLHALRKKRRFSAPKTKNRLFGGRRRSKGLKVGFWVQPPYIWASGGENCPSRFERVPGFSWNPSGGSTKASNEGFMKPP